jgi:hypothetical protein
VDEIAALEQERLTGGRSEGIGAAVAEIECSAVIPFAVASVGIPRQLQLVGVERNNVDPAAVCLEFIYMGRNRMQR